MINIINKSITFRLTAVFFSVTAVFLFLLGLYLMNSMEQDSYVSTQNRLLSYARLIADDLNELFTRKPSNGFFMDYARRAGNDIGSRVTIIDPKGNILGDSVLDKDSMGNHSDRPEIKKAIAGEIGMAARYSSSLQEKMFYYAVPIKKDSSIIGVVRVAIPWSEIEAGQNHIRWSIGTSLFIALILTVIVVSSFTSSIVIPLQEMTCVAREMADGKLDTVITVKSADEIGALGKGLNYMAAHLRETIAQITEERNKIKAILTSINDGVIAADSAGNVLLINPAVERMFNISYENSLGKKVIEVVRNFDLEKLLYRALEGEESLTQEVQIFVPDPKVFRIVTAPLTNETGIVGVVAVLRDITAFREVERMKADFVANVSHELKTPLTSIKGFVETLLDGALEDKEVARHFLEIINDENERLNRLINDLLSLSKIEARQTSVDKKFLNLENVIKNAVSVLSPQAADKKLLLKTEIRGQLPDVEANEDMIGQLLINLIDNAVKYTPEDGRVEITAEKADDWVKVIVSDTGIGIPRESLPRLFERFYRVDKARSREMGGTGLGLAIVKHILEVHNGKIEVESMVGRGSRFIFYLPAKTVQ
jgi:two-component system phosphate regulon sensor histidine kinase PhoR